MLTKLTPEQRRAEQNRVNGEWDALWLYDAAGDPVGVVNEVLDDGTLVVWVIGTESGTMKFAATQYRTDETGQMRLV